MAAPTAGRDLSFLLNGQQPQQAAAQQPVQQPTQQAQPQGRDLSAALPSSAADDEWSAVPPLEFEVSKDVERADAKEQGLPPWWETVLLSIAEPVGAGIVQGANWAGDRLGEGINKVFGTNIGTGNYEAYNKDYSDFVRNYELRRKEAGAGFDLARLIGNIGITAPLGGAVKGLQGAKLASKAGMAFLGENAALGAGLMGAGYADDSGDRLANMAIGAGGGLAGSLAFVGAGKALGAAKDLVVRQVTPQSVTAANIEASLNVAFQDSGLNVADFPMPVQRDLRKVVAQALREGKTVDAETMQRSALFADMKATKGIDFGQTAKQATGDASIWRNETAVSKLNGAERLNQRYIDQNGKLIKALDDAKGATNGTSVDKYHAGEQLFESLSSNDKARSRYISAMYDYAKQHGGNDLLLDPNRFATNMQQTLSQSLLDVDALPPVLLKRIGQFQSGQKKFTLTEKELLIKDVNQALGEMNGPATPQQRALFGFKRALDNETDTALDSFGSQLHGEANQAWKDARKAASGRFGIIDRTPALKKALADTAPDKAFDDLVLKSDIRDLEALKAELVGDPATLASIKQQMLGHIAENSQNANQTFRPVGMANILKKIGDRRLNVLFTPDEVKHIKNIEAAGRYLISEPAFTNTNRSNSASEVINAVNDSALMRYLSKAPFAKQAIDRFVVPSARGLSAEMKISGGSMAKAVNATATKKPLSGAEKEYIKLMEKAGVVITPQMLRPEQPRK